MASVGKHLLTRFDDGSTLHTHFLMDGSWHLYSPGARWKGPDHQVRAVLGVADRTAVGFRLHQMALVPTNDEARVVGHLGPDLLDDAWGPELEATAVVNLTAQPDRELGQALLDQRVLAVNRDLMILILAVMSVIVLANVATRYLSNYSIPWSEELARYLMIWLTFLGIGPVLRAGGHVAIDSLHDSLGPRPARWLRLFIVVLLALFCAVVAWFGSAYVGRTWHQATAVMEIPFSFVAAAVPSGMVLALWHLAAIAGDYVAEGRFEVSADLGEAEAAAI